MLDPVFHTYNEPERRAFKTGLWNRNGKDKTYPLNDNSLHTMLFFYLTGEFQCLGLARLVVDGHCKS